MHESTLSRRRTRGTGSIALSLGLCLCAGQLVAAQPAAAAAITPVVTAAAATSRAHPAVTQRANKRTITAGTLVKVTAKVVNKRTGKVVPSGRVRLQAYKKGWKTVLTRSLAKNGTVAFATRPGSSVAYRTYFLGSAGVQPGASRYSTKVTVKANGSKVVNEAKRHKGALYKYGASGPKRFDCSGFTKYVYRKTTGRKLPHSANQQQRYGKAISKGSKRPGDLIIFRSGSHGYHAAVYAGGNYMWDSPHSGARVGKHKIFSKNYVVRRLV